MYAILAGFIAGILSFLVVLNAGKGKAIAAAIINGLFMLVMAYVLMPTLNMSFLDLWVVALIPIMITCAFAFSEGEKAPISVALGILLIVAEIVGLIIFPFVSSAAMWRGSDYAAVLGSVETRVLADDIAPIDITKARSVPYATALKNAQKLLGADPGLGSQTYIDGDELTSQKINGCFTARYYDLNKQGGQITGPLCFDNEIVYVAALEHSGFWRWSGNGSTPGYVIVSASNMNRVYLVTGIGDVQQAPAKTETTRMGSPAADASGIQPVKLRYIPSAFFGDDLARHIYLNGYMSQGFTDYTLEVDDNGRPFFTATLYEKTVGYSGDNATGIVVVDPETGDMQAYSIKDAPAWIDRIQPKEFVSTQIDDHGNYVHGWWNFSNKDVLRATDGIDLVEGADGQTYYYTGMSGNGNDQASVGFMLVNTRTKAARWYQTTGATEAAAMHSAEQTKGVKEAGYHANFPVLYRVDGLPTYFTVLLGTDNLPKMYAFVNLTNYDIVGVGKDIHEALRDYQRALNSRGLSNINEVTTDKAISSKVKLISTETAGGNTIYYFLLEGEEGKQFAAPYDLSPELKFTRDGDVVKVTAKEGASLTVPLSAFDNLNINLP